MSGRLVLTLALTVVAAPALAETAEERLERQCRRGWEAVTALREHVPLTGQYDGVEDGWCQLSKLALVTNGYTPDVYVDRLRLRGAAVGWFLLGETGPSPVVDLDAQVEGLRLVPQMGDPQMDYLYLVQSNAWPIRAELSIGWEPERKLVTLSKLAVDFPGENALAVTARVANVDLASASAIQMSASGFAVMDATLDVTSKGLFESYLLMSLGPVLLPREGDMAAAVEGLQAQAVAGIAELPEAAFPADTKAALTALVQELPNPSGRLTASFRAPAGFGPARLAAFAAFGVPTTLAEAAPLFQGITLEASWTHQDMAE